MIGDTQRKTIYGYYHYCRIKEEQVPSLLLRQGLCNFHDLHLVLYNPLPNRGLWSPRSTQRALIVFYFSLLAQAVNSVDVRPSSLLQNKKVRFVLNLFIVSVHILSFEFSNFICINCTPRAQARLNCNDHRITLKLLDSVNNDITDWFRLNDRRIALQLSLV